MPQTHSLEVCADLKDLRQIGPWIVSKIGLVYEEEQVALMMPSIALAIQELAVNIVEHGYEASAGKTFALQLTTSQNHVEVLVVDSGNSYDPDAVAIPAIEDLQVGGYGVMLIKKLTSLFRVTRKDGKNLTTLRFDVPPVAA